MSTNLTPIKFGNTSGRAKTVKEPPVPDGCFNPLAEACWITGLKDADKDLRPSTRKYVRKAKRSITANK